MRERGSVVALVVFVAAASAGLAAPPPGILTEAELAAGGKKQAKERFRRLPPETKIRLKDGRVVTKAELVAEGKRKKPDPRSAAPSAGDEASRLTKLNAELSARTAAKLEADGAKAKAAIQQFKVPDSAKLECPAPKVHSVFPLSNFTPGGWVVVTGCGFKTTPGQFVLILSQTGQEIPIGSLQWAPKGVGGQIPVNHPAFKTAPTQPATLQVKTPAGTATSPMVIYRAPREVRALLAADYVAVASTESDEDSCVDDGSWTLCQHYTVADPLGGDYGYDKFIVTLKNGWTYDSVHVTWGKGGWNWGSSWPQNVGKSVMSGSILWDTICGYQCGAYYYLTVYIEGEVGTKWK